ncbi:MAG: NAD-dependent epimerase/dehydratase family protein [Candidatus Rokubacteria bacterium]|nr:NAD-dependent epimerase/dehydratase family protein [Candidatus Rokubacteria bacterium]
MNLLVTGGAGFVGSHVVDRLLGDGHAVTVVDDLSTGRRALVSPRARLHVCDVGDDAIASIVADPAPAALVHVAAQASVSRSVADPMFDARVNYLGTITLLEAARRAGVGTVVYTSTGGAGYGDTDVVPTPEDHPMRPSSPYGVSKIAAERYVECWAGLTGARAVTLRLANVYGPRQDPRGEAGVIAIFSERLVAGQPCVVNGDGEQTRDFVYVGDVAEAVSRALGTPGAAGALNIGTGLETTINDVHARLARAAGVTSPAIHGPAKPGEQRRSALAATRAKAVLGWTPATVLDEGLARTLAYFKETPP